MKKTFQFLALLAVGVCFAFALPKTGEPKRINVVIDAGHGGKDHGAAHEAFTEKQITDAIASKIKTLNTDKEVVLLFTREGDEFVDLNSRVEAMNTVKPDLVLSLHVNYTKNDEKSGMEFFVYKDGKHGAKSEAYANRLSDKFERKGYRVADLQSAPFYTLKKSEVPAIVVELGYLSNEIDREYLTGDASQNEIAGVVAEFLKEIK
ncbi:N-acetylmuramoyl-L-alanine amidase [Flavobacterium sp. DG1-102-2]|uniref:N-acetylmuramoyl-L-alanine amidase family protein n=1 Tax=Flavobacterium sp. DG1-102-2 TaxID=3081663 RepID=UPI002949A158|nr:N-acetylmuramoyl-L-alanine amidase [Flavobacterium sp. DG1-102-2]MDV6168007.1 N-acetylmuramoyl-L-alanine amidase [Flavobacterium sp. DG1-102-2]